MKIAERPREVDLALLQQRGIPAEHAHRFAADEFHPTPPLERAKEWLTRPREQILVLSGTNGCGKSFAAAWAVANGDGSSLFLPAGKLMRVSPYVEKQMEPLEQASVLAIDGLGTEYADEKGMFFAVLDGLMDARHSDIRKTIVTTDLAAESFCDRYGQRIADRVRDGAFFECKDPSLRGRGKRSETDVDDN